jgi:hypothetical protein
MVVRTTVDIPGELHKELRKRSLQTGSSIRSLIVGAIEERYVLGPKGRPVTGPLVRGKGRLGPLARKDVNLNTLMIDDDLSA